MNFLHVSSCEILHFVTPYKRKQTPESGIRTGNHLESKNASIDERTHWDRFSESPFPIINYIDDAARTRNKCKQGDVTAQIWGITYTQDGKRNHSRKSLDFSSIHAAL